MAAFVNVDDDQLEQFQADPALKPRTIDRDKRNIVSFDNMDKPYFITTKIASTHREAAERDLSNGPLHSFMLNGRKPDDFMDYFKKIATTRLQFMVVTKAVFGDKMLNLFHNLLCLWSQHIYKVTGNSASYTANSVVFLTDKKNNDKVYLPCCNDVKRIGKQQLLNHYVQCLTDRVGKTKCGFCSSTDLNTGISTDVNYSDVHVSSNNHLNSIYQVLIMHEQNGLMMADARVMYDYVCCRPLGNLFLMLYTHPHSEEAYIDFLATHLSNALKENTPFFGIMLKMIRMAKNYGKNCIDFQCEQCDCSGTAFSRFYIASIFGTQTARCECGGARYSIGIDDFVAKVAEIKKKMEKKNLADIQSMRTLQQQLTFAFAPEHVSAADAISKSDIDKIFRLTSANNLTVHTGQLTTSVVTAFPVATSNDAVNGLVYAASAVIYDNNTANSGSFGAPIQPPPRVSYSASGQVGARADIATFKAKITNNRKFNDRRLIIQETNTYFKKNKTGDINRDSYVEIIQDIMKDNNIQMDTNDNCQDMFDTYDDAMY